VLRRLAIGSRTLLLEVAATHQVNAPLHDGADQARTLRHHYQAHNVIEGDQVG